LTGSEKRGDDEGEGTAKQLQNLRKTGGADLHSEKESAERERKITSHGKSGLKG